MNLEFYSDAFFQMLGGVPLTLKLAASSIVFGAFLALLLALMRLSGLTVLD
ncbi:ABC transporter permease, partial [Ochrobactrum sp. 721/2009]